MVNPSGGSGAVAGLVHVAGNAVVDLLVRGADPQTGLVIATAARDAATLDLEPATWIDPEIATADIGHGAPTAASTRAARIEPTGHVDEPQPGMRRSVGVECGCDGPVRRGLDGDT